MDKLDKSLEDIMKENKVKAEEGSGGPAKRTKKQKKAQAQTPKPLKTVQGTPIMCFGCGGDHKKRDCPNKDKRCDVCHQVGHTKIMCRVRMRDGCHVCGSLEHVKSDCPNKEKRCDRCLMVGHLKSTCKHPALCRACGEPGHRKADCRFATSVCRECGKVGHIMAVCF